MSSLLYSPGSSPYVLVHMVGPLVATEALLTVIWRYAKHLKNLSKDFKAFFKDIQRVLVPDWIVTLFDFNVQNADINSQLQDELADMRVDLEAQSLFKRKNLPDSAI